MNFFRILYDLLMCAMVLYCVFHIGYTRIPCKTMKLADVLSMYYLHPHKWIFDLRGPVHISQSGARHRVILSPIGYLQYIMGGYWY